MIINCMHGGWHKVKDLLSEIESYWTTRAEGYSEVNHKELNGMQKGAWLEVLKGQFPEKAKDEIKILDIGTGPGFFPVILAEAGYKVTAVDYTQEMLDTAKKNAGNLCERISFYKMDAQNLEFEDDVFDVVISRNLTWNLKDPKRAYEEWCRVLKPGGKLLNFDANWYGYLYDEYDNLFRSLYDKPEKHMAILEALAKKKDGLTRAELSKEKEIGGGSVLTKDLRELEECGFIRKYNNFSKAENDSLYQLIDPFTLFSIRFIQNKKFDSWKDYINSPGYNSWRGSAFEIVCLNHINQIKSALGISGIETNEFAWKSSNTEKGAQIDLIISRKDGVINLCEMKYTNEAYSLDAEEHEKIMNRLSQFQKEMGTKEAIHITLICGNGYKQSKYSGSVQNVILGDDLFDN